MEILKPCPFCGGEAGTKESRFEGAGYYVECKRCRTSTRLIKTEAEAIQAWNTRAERTCHNTQSDFDFMCSECGKCVDNGRVLGINYCPMCGAKVVE